LSVAAVVLLACIACLQDEVLLEFHVDDTTNNDREDKLVEMVFHVPNGHETWGGTVDDDGKAIPAAKVR
jgi:hypothetical protein